MTPLTPLDFARLLFPSGYQGALTLWEQSSRRSLHLPYDDLLQINVALGEPNVYLSPTTRILGLTESERGSESQLLECPGLWLDIDSGPHHAASSSLPQTDDEALSILEPLPEPTLVVDSGHGLHCYWLFDQPLAIAHYPNLRRLSDEFQERARRATRFHLDNTASLDRLLRPPGTVNAKPSLPPLPVRTLVCDGPRYTPTDLGYPATQSPSTALLDDPVPALVRPTTPTYSDLPTDQDLILLLKNLRRPDSAQLIQHVLRGTSFAAPGERDTQLNRVASILAYLAPHRDPTSLAEGILAPSLSTWDDVDTLLGYNQASRLIWAAEKIARAQRSAQEDHANKARSSALLLSHLTASVRTSPNKGPYTPADLESFAKQQNCTPEEFAKRWVIHLGNANWVYIDGCYTKAISNSDLPPSLPRDLAPAIEAGYVSLTTASAKGNLRHKELPEILREYATCAKELKAHLDLQHSYYDPKTLTFHEALTPLRPITPTYHQAIDDWMVLLGGQHPDKLLDWVASVSLLDRQTSALYLHGVKSTGKTLLAAGLARLWTEGAPANLDHVLGSFAEDLTRCPLILADEHLNTRSASTAALRSLIGTSARTLNRKFLPSASLSGAVRLILTANNLNLLGFDESLSPEDIAAVANRFLLIECNPLAASFLQLHSTKGWVTEDRIAEHALWLQLNRPILPGSRFLVEGDADRVAFHLATQSGPASRVVEWLVRYLCETPLKQLTDQRESAYLDLQDPPRFLVNTSAPVDHWEKYSRSRFAPTSAKIGEGLKNLSDRTTRVGNRRFYEISVPILRQWSATHLIGSPEVIDARLAGQDVPL